MSGAPESRWPSQDEALAMLTEWEDWNKRVDAMLDSLEKAFGDFAEAPLREMLQGLFDTYTRQIAARLGDESQWMEWFYFENDMGAKQMQAGYDDHLTPVATLSDLLALIVQSRSRKDA